MQIQHTNKTTQKKNFSDQHKTRAQKMERFRETTTSQEIKPHEIFLMYNCCIIPSFFKKCLSIIIYNNFLVLPLLNLQSVPVDSIIFFCYFHYVLFMQKNWFFFLLFFIQNERHAFLSLVFIASTFSWPKKLLCGID